MKNIFFYDTPVGRISISDNGKAITDLCFEKENEIFDAELKETSLIKEASKQIKEYFEGKRKVFELPLDANGTEFQQKVWNELQKVPYGETRSYGQIAKNIGQPKASRAVGMANNRNPISIIIP